MNTHTHTHTHLSISVRISGRLAAMLVLVPNFLPNGKSQTTASTLPLDRGSPTHTHTHAHNHGHAHTVFKNILTVIMYILYVKCF